MTCAATDDLEVRGLNLIQPGQPVSDRVLRIRQQLRAADAQVQVERDESEPAAVNAPRRRGEDLLGQRLYEDAEEAFLDAIDAGLAHDHFCWQAALNVVNCQLFLRRLDDAESTAAQLQEMFAAQPEHPLHYLAATQRGALAAERWSASGDPADAQAALDWARLAYDWQINHRGAADGLRAYNLAVALLRLDQREAARAVCRAHRADEAFLAWCRQGEQADLLGPLIS